MGKCLWQIKGRGSRSRQRNPPVYNPDLILWKERERYESWTGAVTHGATLRMARPGPCGSWSTDYPLEEPCTRQTTTQIWYPSAQQLEGTARRKWGLSWMSLRPTGTILGDRQLTLFLQLLFCYVLMESWVAISAATPTWLISFYKRFILCGLLDGVEKQLNSQRDNIWNSWKWTRRKEVKAELLEFKYEWRHFSFHFLWHCLVFINFGWLNWVDFFSLFTMVYEECSGGIFLTSTVQS